MLLKNHLIEVFKKASLENNILLKENMTSAPPTRHTARKVSTGTSSSAILIIGQFTPQNKVRKNNRRNP